MIVIHTCTCRLILREEGQLHLSIPLSLFPSLSRPLTHTHNDMHTHHAQKRWVDALQLLIRILGGAFATHFPKPRRATTELVSPGSQSWMGDMNDYCIYLSMQPDTALE